MIKMLQCAFINMSETNEKIKRFVKETEMSNKKTEHTKNYQMEILELKDIITNKKVSNWLNGRKETTDERLVKWKLEK